MFLLRFENNYFYTIESNLSYFQITLSMRSVVTSIQLSGLKLVDGNKCVYYFNDLETLLHLLSNYSAFSCIIFGML